MNIGQVYTFNMLAPSILGGSRTNVTINAIMNYATAAQYFNPSAAHANVYPFLPAGTLNDPTKFTYYLLQAQDGTLEPICSAWIDQQSLTIVSQTSLTITVGNASASDVAKIRSMLAVMGYSSLTFTVNDTM